MRISATQLESFRLFMAFDWMPEQELIDTIAGKFDGNHKVWLGQAFGRVLEDPDQFLVPGGFRVQVDGKAFAFGSDVMQQPLALIDRRGVFEAKAVGRYGEHEVSSKADHLLGSHLSEFKTTLSSFNFDKYAESCQWRFMADAFEPSRVTYHVFCLDEATNGVISLRDVHSFDLYPYAGLHEDCADLVRQFVDYVTARGLDHILRQRQVDAA